jgi:hypothetical protein
MAVAGAVGDRQEPCITFASSRTVAHGLILQTRNRCATAVMHWRIQVRAAGMTEGVEG